MILELKLKCFFLLKAPFVRDKTFIEKHREANTSKKGKKDFQNF